MTQRTLQELNDISLMATTKNKVDITDPTELYAVVSGYFNECKDNDLLPTMTGLAIKLGTNRKELLSYCQENQDMAYAVNQAKQIIIEHVERLPLNGRPPAGLIFWLKNNDDWIDKTEITHSNKKMSDILDELEQSGQLITANPINDVSGKEEE